MKIIIIAIQALSSEYQAKITFRNIQFYLETFGTLVLKYQDLLDYSSTIEQELFTSSPLSMLSLLVGLVSL